MLLLVGMFVLVALTRAPFYSMRLAGEEGEFGRSITTIAAGHLPRAVIARSGHGHELLIPAGHNLGGYLLIAVLFMPVLKWTRFSSIEQRTRAATGLRACFGLLYAAALGLALWLLRPERRLRGALLLVAASLATLPLIGSVQVNYDGAISTFVVVAALLAFHRAVERRSVGWACAAGFVASVGKIEFAAAIAAALVVTELFARRARLAIAMLLALGLGLVAWHLVDPVNARYGAGLVTRYWALSGGFSAPLWSRALAYARTHAALMAPVYVGVPLVVVHVLVHRRPLPRVAPVVLTLLFIAAGFHLIAWRGDGFPRYLAPCFPLLAIALAELELGPRAAGAAVAALLVFGVVQYRGLLPNRQNALGALIGSTRDDHDLASELEAHPRDCITVTQMDAGVGFYSARASFACCFAQWGSFAADEHESLCP